MRSMILIIGLTMLPAAYGQTPPPFPSFPSPPANAGSPPPLDLTIKPMAPPPATVQTPPLQQTASYKDPVKPGDQVRLLRGTYIRSGPSEQSYSCGKLEGGMTAIVLDYPEPGSEYTPIAAPDNCYSLIPISAVHHTWAVWVDLKKLMNQPQKILKPTESLMYGEEPVANYLSSGYIFPKGSMVTIIDEKRIKVKGKEAMYCIIRSGGREKRYVRTADLEGVAAAAKAAQPTTPQNNFPLYGDNRAQQKHWQDTAPAQQAVLESEQLPPYLASQVQQAEQAYRTAQQYGAWEDARQRYMQLLESEVLSVRILAKNRLEFISDWQRNPPVVTTAMSPQQGAGLSPALNHEPWVPGSVAATRPVATAPAATTSILPPVKDLVVKPNQPAVPASNPPFTVPTYPGTPAPQQQVPQQPFQQQPVKQQAPPVNTTIQPQGQPVSRPGVATAPPVNTSPPPATAASTSATPVTPAPQRVKVVGKLNRAVQYTGPNPLYYLTNSQGFMTYYVRGTLSPGLKINDYLGRNIEVEGVAVQAVIDGQKKPQINVDKARLLQ